MLPEAKESHRSKDWAIITGQIGDDPAQMEKLIAALADPLIDVIRWGIKRPPELKANHSLQARWTHLQEYIQKQGELPKMMAHKAATFYEGINNAEPHKAAPSPVNQPAARPLAETPQPPAKAEAEPPPPPSPKPPEPLAITRQRETTSAVPDDSSEVTVVRAQNELFDETTIIAPVTHTETSINGETMKEESEIETSATPSIEASTTPSLAPQWKYLPVPDDPDKHTEYDSHAGVSPEGLKLIGARARGKKHKHEGTNCDDWFKFTASGPWTIIAVSDGAGSKAFSRVGAKVACNFAVKRLVEDLREHQLKSREVWTAETLKRDETNGSFVEEDLEAVQIALHNAMVMAYGALVAAAEDRAESSEHEKVLGRKVEVDDLSATLLLAVHTTVKYKEGDRNFVLACQIGDGMLGAIDQKGRLQLLGEPDSGEFAGQTDFLTSRNKVDKDNLTRKTRGFFSPLQSLMVMTDGVADDYYPNDPDLLRLYGDLALNQIIEIKGPSDKDVAARLELTKLPTLDQVMQADFYSDVETNTAEGIRKTRLKSVAAYAEKLDLPLAEVVASPALLLAGARGEPLCDGEAQDRLRVWLDSYHVRGSFDDRTLVVLHRETVS
ncbi:MAG: protein phosphatase 2C domain-containing protein [Pyrinomonadaceae bacterium]|nr:protein phosphatase 2C domain-containing protein [Pyrinomonadaceae bacterium]